MQMYYVGYESLVDTEETDYRRIMPNNAMTSQHSNSQYDVSNERGGGGSSGGGGDLLSKEKPINVLTIVQDKLEICTNMVGAGLGVVAGWGWLVGCKTYGAYEKIKSLFLCEMNSRKLLISKRCKQN